MFKNKFDILCLIVAPIEVLWDLARVVFVLAAPLIVYSAITWHFLDATIVFPEWAESTGYQQVYYFIVGQHVDGLSEYVGRNPLLWMLLSVCVSATFYCYRENKVTGKLRESLMKK
jgi:hypothetical protein